jgi:mono/diheme cytochrome c family protein
MSAARFAVLGVRIALCLCGFTVLAALEAQNARAAADSAGGASDPGRSQVGRGRYLVAAGNCVSCHTRPGGAPFSGGLAFSTPFGVIYSSNITPDPSTGIADWTAADLRQALHEGVGRGGYRLFPAFPYTSFTLVSDEDADAIYAYLRSIPAVSYRPPDNSFVFHLRWGMRIWNALFFRPGRFQADARQSPEWNRGAYLVNGLGHCDACHTPRDLFMAETGTDSFAGGSFFDRVIDDRIRRWSAVNLTSAHSGLAAWSVDELANYLKNGFVATRAASFGPMNDVIVNSLRNLGNEDVRAIATYLKSLPARQLSDATVPADSLNAGARIYGDRCAECHDGSGAGGEESAPPLVASAVVQNSDPASLINIVLYGPTLPKGLTMGDWDDMRPFNDVLNDAQIADVINYVRGSWGNRAPPVTAADIARQR